MGDIKPVDDLKPKPEQNSIIDNPEVAAAIKRFYVDNKGKTVPPYKHSYFTKPFGVRAKEIVDFVVEHKKPYKISVDPGYTIHAVRQQWYEGTRYLRLHMDPDHKYTQLLALMRCHVEFDYIEIRPRPALRGLLLELGEEKLILQDDKWKAELTEWLDSNPPEHAKFEKLEVELAESDIQWGYQQLIGVEKLYYGTFEQNKIVIIRFTHE